MGVSRRWKIWRTRRALRRIDDDVAQMRRQLAEFGEKTDALHEEFTTLRRIVDRKSTVSDVPTLLRTHAAWPAHLRPTLRSRPQPKETEMAVVYIQEIPIDKGDLSTTNYDAIAERIKAEGLPDGMLIHTAGFDLDDDVFRILDVWETQQQAQRFIDERLTPIMNEWATSSGLDLSKYPPPTRDGFYELHDVIKL